MTTITASTPIRPRRPVPAAPAEDDHQPTNHVPGPDERSLARTTTAVVTSLVLLVGTVVLIAVGAGSVVNALAEWVFNR